MSPFHVIILAAGESTRLKSNLTKVLHPICGRPMLDYVLDAARSLHPKKICIVVGQDRKVIEQHLKGQTKLTFAHQKDRLGTAHATQVGLKALGKITGQVLILNGDVPLLTPRTLKQLLKTSSRDSLALVTALLPNPTGYGRILRDPVGTACEIVEEKNANLGQKQINEINAGIYRAEAAFLEQALKKVKKDPCKGEYYLTDIVAWATGQGKTTATFTLEDSQEILGANTRGELAYLNQLVRDALVSHHLSHGVGMQDPGTTYLDYGIRIGEDTWLEAGVQLHGDTRIGHSCRIEAGAVLRDVRLQDGVTIRAYSHLEDCKVRSGAVIGPFARVRPGSSIEEGARVGNFVELKKTHLGRNSKANHLSYLGDTRVGKNVNIGAGTITCNYDGKNKFPTFIGDGVFVGSNSQLVAPVRLGKGSYVGAGSTITKDVPPDALALTRAPQRNIPNYLKKKRK